MADSTKVKMGVCSVVFNGTDLGHTKGGVEVIYKPEYKDIEVDMYTGAPDKILTAEAFSAKVPLAERTAANISNSIPAGTLSTAGGRNKLTVGRKAGFRLSTVAKRLVLHPMENAVGNTQDDVVIWSAVSIGEVTLPYKKDEETVIAIEFMSLVNETNADGNYLATIGDTTV